MSACVGTLPPPAHRGIHRASTGFLTAPALVPLGFVLALLPQQGVETAIVGVGRVGVVSKLCTARKLTFRIGLKAVLMTVP